MNFQLASTPQLHFGEGKLSLLPSLVKTFGTRALLVTGARSFRGSVHGYQLLQKFKDELIATELFAVTGEPSPATIDSAVQQHAGFAPDVVVAIGGGSALDAGKAISAMLLLNRGVKDFLEGVGTAAHPGTKVPFIAVPTTSGTGSEATKNAVISEIGVNGYKRSLRHNNFVPDVAVLDPSLTAGCPPATTAASGMDAFTQLLESYLSTSANPITDTLALEGLKRVSRSLLQVYHVGEDLNARTDMALAAYLSGITLAGAGLGLVHGFASPVGGYFHIPHGVICSALMGSCNRVTVRKLRNTKSNATALKKYSVAGKIFLGEYDRPDDYNIDFLLDLIDRWTDELHIPSLQHFGVTSEDFPRIVEKTDAKNNPIRLEKEEMIEVLKIAGA